jgi:hypothetical protein
MTLPLRQALSRIFDNRPASTIGELEILGAVSKPKAYYRLHLINAFVDPPKESWTKYIRMSESQARYWQGHATRPGKKWIALCGTCGRLWLALAL